MPSSHLILCRPLLLLPPIPPSIRAFPNESTLCMMWPKYWSFSFSISPSEEHSGPISFRKDWLDVLAVQGTLKSLLQHHSSKASILQCSAFFTVQLSHPYMATSETRWLWFSSITSLYRVLWAGFTCCHSFQVNFTLTSLNDTDVCEGTFLINLKNTNLGDVENTFGTNFYQFMVKNIRQKPKMFSHYQK